MTNRGLATLIIQFAASCAAAYWAVGTGVPYIGLSNQPLPWWRSALRWPWWIVGSVGSSLRPLQIMIVLFAVYTVLAFLIIKSLATLIGTVGGSSPVS